VQRRIGAAGLRAAPALWSSALAVLMLGGALGPGYVLTYDMVWVPELAMRGDFWGTGSSLPRAVPSDLVVALLDGIVPGMLLQKAVLLGTLVLAGTGAARLVRGPGLVGLVGPLAAATLYVWNPFVVERLGIGHWPLLMTYASLPWIHLCARRLASGERVLPLLVLWLAFASLSPVGGLVAGAMAVIGVAASGRAVLRSLLWTTGAVVAVNAPWIVAGAIHGSGTVSDPTAVALFAAQGEGVLPPWAAALGLGGIWNAEVVPASRTTWVGLAATVLVVAVCVAGVRLWRQGAARADQVALAVPAVLGLALALVGAGAPDAVAWVVAHVPGAGLLRDGTRFLALAAPLQALLFGYGVARLAAAPKRGLGVSLGTALVLAPVAVMPDGWTPSPSRGSTPRRGRRWRTVGPPSTMATSCSCHSRPTGGPTGTTGGGPSIRSAATSPSTTSRATRSSCPDRRSRGRTSGPGGWESTSRPSTAASWSRRWRARASAGSSRTTRRRRPSQTSGPTTTGTAPRSTCPTPRCCTGGACSRSGSSRPGMRPCAARPTGCRSSSCWHSRGRWPPVLWGWRWWQQACGWQRVARARVNCVGTGDEVLPCSRSSELETMTCRE
jgi:hypothetical protein